MRGDIVRALIELITNADDAYGDADGDIRVEIVRSHGGTGTIFVTVRDHARGLDADGLVSCFSTLGARSSGFEEGRQVRGNLGRGAKDTAAFGTARFEAIRDGKYSCFDLDRDGTWELTDENRPATDDDFARLEIPDGGNGLSATVVVKGSTKVDQFTRLFERLSRTCQLRILTAERPTFLVEDLGNGPSEHRVRYDAPDGQLVLDEHVPVPQYPGVVAHLHVDRLAQRHEGAPSAEADHGLLVVGTRAVYENTFFKTGTRVHAGWFRGELRCEYIDTLIREFDDREAKRAPHPADNPQRILSRDRDGLVREHPFTQALDTLVARALGPLIDAAEKESDTARREGQGLRQTLRTLSEDLIQQLRHDLEEIDETEPGSGKGERKRTALAVIPPKVVLRSSTDKALAVIASSDVARAGEGVIVESGDESVCAISDATGRFETHPRFEDSLITQVRIKTLAVGATNVTVRAGSHAATCAVVVNDDVPAPPDPPTSLMFAHAQVTATLGRKRTVELWAPIELVRDNHTAVTVRADGAAITLDATTVELHFDDSRGWFVGKVPFTGVRSGERATVRAEFHGETAEATVRVVEPTDPTALGFEIIVTNESSLSARAVIESGPDGLRMQIFGQHPALAHMLGKHTEGGFEHEGARHVRVVFAEVIAGELADWLLEREATKNPERFQDSASLLAGRRRRVSTYLPRAQRLLLAESE
jgi:hypothetical protein